MFLEEHLLQAGGDWERYVIDKLSYAQAQAAREQAWRSLADLDLAALLRVIDLNWELFRRQGLVTPEARSWLKESMAVRNRSAHRSGREPSIRNEYRDLDTLARLCGALGSPSDEAAISKELDGLLAPPGSPTPQDPDGETSTRPGATRAVAPRPIQPQLVHKYGALQARLSAEDDVRLQLAFDEIEQILDAKLPPSAWEHRSWWANDSTHSQAQAWLDAGWRVSRVSLTQGSVALERAAPPGDVRQQGRRALVAWLQARGWTATLVKEGQLDLVLGERAASASSADQVAVRFNVRRDPGDWQLDTRSGDRTPIAEKWALITVADGLTDVRVFASRAVSDLVRRKHADYLERHGGHRAENDASTHFGLRPTFLSELEADRWDGL